MPILALRSSNLGIQQLPHTEHVWDKHAIKAAIYRKGKTLSDLAKENGIPAPTLRSALVKPTKNAEIIISNFLNIPVYELFPDRWTKENKRIYPRTSKHQLESK